MEPWREELYHHGIKGMRWGVRRYQNYDGSYTKRGLARYHKAEKDYMDAKEKVRSQKEAYKNGTGTKVQYKTAKAELKSAKRNLNKSYDRLKNDKQADEGKKLYRRGKTITSNAKMLAVSETATIIGANVASSLLYAKTGSIRLASLSGSTIALGGTAVNAILGVKTNSENKKLRAYYAH